MRLELIERHSSLRIAALIAAVAAFAGSSTAWGQTGSSPAQAKPPGIAVSATPPPGEGAPPGEQGGVYSDPLAPFNSAMLTFNMKLDDWVLRPAARGYSFVAPQPVRESVGRFFDNVNVIPRVANNLFQLRFAEAGGEVARFGINTTVGVLGFFDPAQNWFGIQPHPDDFGLTIRHYDVPTGPYLMLPFFGPSTIGDAIGLAADGAMNPMSYLLPWWITLSASAGQRAAEAINYRSLHMNQFEEVDRYAVDLYGAIQDAYLQNRINETNELKK